MPVAFATCGITFGPTRCQLEILARMPLCSPSSPRYAPHGQLMITTSTGFACAETPSSPFIQILSVARMASPFDGRGADRTRSGGGSARALDGVHELGAREARQF